MFIVRRYEYLWADGERIKKPIKCSAPEYVDHLMTWVQRKLDNEAIFPSRVGELKYFSNTKPKRMHIYIYIYTCIFNM